jgi:nucleotide-binding universal stress UspA family protein
MFRRVLVPLDGSPLAEAVMPAVRHLAAALQGEVTLLHMIERHVPRTVHGQPHLATAELADRYLVELAARTLPADLPITRHVHSSKIDDVARGIVAHAEELQMDLIVLCTHGAGGVRHGLFGTVAERVIALGVTPVLLIPSAPSGDVASFSCRRLLVPLDGQAEHEQGLSALERLGAACGAEVLLLMVIPTWRHLKQQDMLTSRLLPGTTAELLDTSLDPARTYLDEKIASMRHTDPASAARRMTANVVRGEPVSELVRAAHDFNADMIVLGTHGKSHGDAFWSGSVTPQLVQQSRLPVLLVPIQHPG